MENKTAQQPDESGLLILELLGNKYPAKLTIKEWRLAEKLLGRPLANIFIDAQAESRYFIEEMATIFQGCIRGYGEARPPSLDDICQHIADAGIMKFYAVYLAILIGALKGKGEPESGEATASKA